MRTTLSTMFLIAGTELRRRMRDGSLLIIALVAPLGLAVVFSFLLGPISTGGIDIAVGLVDEDGTDLSAGLADVLVSLDAEGVVSLTTDLAEEEGRGLIGGDLDTLVVVPAGFGAQVFAGADVDIAVIGDVDAGIATEVTRSIVGRYLQRVRSTGLALAALDASGADPTTLPAVAAAAADVPDPVSVGEIEAATRLLDASTYYTAAMAVFFVFFTVQAGVTSLLDERREGTMARLLAAPIAHTTILGGKALASFILGIGSMAVLAVGAQVFVGADWGPPMAVGLLVIAVVLAALGIMAIIAGLASTPESAGNIQAIVAVTLGALGGSFFQIASEGPVAVLSAFTPHRWFLSGLGDLAGGGGVTAVLPATFAILAFAAVTGVVGWVLLLRKLTP